MSRTDAQGRQMPNKHEHALMLDLMMLRNSLAHHGEAVRQRLAGYPYSWRDMRLLWHLVNKLQRQLLDTMPDRRVAYYDQMARHGQVIIDIPGPIPRGRHILITERHLAAITEAAMCGECALCIRDGKEVQRCPIREALLEVAPPETVSDCQNRWAGCEYRNAASALIQGEEITI